VLVDRVQVGVRCPPAEEAGAALLTLTGSFDHVKRLAAIAAERGLILGPRGLQSDAGAPIAGTEEDIYAALGLPFIPAEIREGMEGALCRCMTYYRIHAAIKRTVRLTRDKGKAT
jgi:DNA polymerase (family 10)